MRERLNVHKINGEATGPNRTPAIEQMLKTEREALAETSEGTWDRSVVEHNIALLEKQLDQSKRNDEARKQIEGEIAERRREEQAAAESRRAAKAQAEADSLRHQYRAANPGATDAEVEAVLPSLVEQHRQQRTERVLNTMRAKYAV